MMIAGSRFVSEKDSTDVYQELKMIASTRNATISQGLI